MNIEEIFGEMMRRQSPSLMSKDLIKRPTYGYRAVKNSTDVANWFKDQGITSINPNDMHVTFVYSKEPIDKSHLVSNKTNQTIIIRGGERSVELFGEDKNVLVLKMSDPTLEQRHQDAIDIGASWDWDEYVPHITISYDFEGSIENIEPYQGEIILGPEKFEELDDEWSPSE